MVSGCKPLEPGYNPGTTRVRPRPTSPFLDRFYAGIKHDPRGHRGTSPSVSIRSQAASAIGVLRKRAVEWLGEYQGRMTCRRASVTLIPYQGKRADKPALPYRTRLGCGGFYRMLKGTLGPNERAFLLHTCAVDNHSGNSRQSLDSSHPTPARPGHDPGATSPDQSFF